MSSLSERLEFAQKYRMDRVHYEPHTKQPIYDGNFYFELTGPVQDRELEALKCQELSFGHSSVLSSQEIRVCVKSAMQGELLDNVESRIFEAVRRESHALDTFDEIEALGDVYSTSLGGPVRSINDLVRVTWGAPDILGMPVVRGRFFLETADIEIYAHAPEAWTTVNVLCEHGMLPWQTQTYVHEKLHALQYNLFRGQNEPELFEAQAHRISMDDRGIQNHDLLVRDLVDSPAYEDLDPKKLHAAIWVIDRLNALGLSQKEVICVLKHAGTWNSLGCWGGLEDFIQAEMRRRAISGEDLERELMAYNLRRTIEVHKARIAASTVLYDEFHDIIDLRRRVVGRLRLQQDCRGEQAFEQYAAGI